MAYAVPLDERRIGPHRPFVRRLASRFVTWLVTAVGMSVCVGTLLVLLADAVAEDEPRRRSVTPDVGVISLPYGGQLERPDPADIIEPGGLMGLGLLALGLANGLAFALAAALDGMRGPSAAETRRRLRNRRERGVVPGGRREVARTVVMPAATPAASSDPLGVVGGDDLPARRSVPRRAAAGTTYAPLPASREREPRPVPTRPAAAAEPAPEPAPTPEPVPAPRAPARRPSPVPRDGGDGRPSPATRRGSGPWGWRPARLDPVPWRNPMPWPALAGAR